MYALIAKQAFVELFPSKDSEQYTFNIKYSDHFKPYNANVRYTKNSFTFNMSKKWRKVSKEIQMGLMQELLLKVFKQKKQTLYMDLYANFMKSLHIAVPKTKSDPVLIESFNRVNNAYFDGLVELTNLVWHDSLRRLGTYEYGSDTISMSEILQDEPGLLDYVMYHEMLHKVHKFNSKNGRNHYHTKQFRDDEKKFKDFEVMERKLKRLIRAKKLASWF